MKHRKGFKMLKFEADADYGKTILEKITIRLLHNVQVLLSASSKKDTSIEASEKFISNYFQAKIDGYFENDRLMFLDMPDGLEERIPDEETYTEVNNAYVSAFLEGYKKAVVDMQELESLAETISVIRSSDGKQEEPKAPEQAKNSDIPF